ncbi:MAG: CDP-alcohol phosphatidyltransferase family protein [Fidelibacterota bacterium]
MPEMKKTRETHTLLSFIEKPLIKKLVSILPARTTPDTLTLIGLFGSIVTGLGYFLSNYSNCFLWLSSFGLLINWFGDSLDGSLARYRNIERPHYGFFIDHTIDSVSMVLIAVGAGLSPYARFDLVLLALTAYLLMSTLVYINTAASGVFRIAFYGFGPTEIRIFIIIVNTVIFFLGAGQFHFKDFAFTTLDVAAIFLSLILFIFYIVSAVIDGKKLKRKEDNIND